MEVLIKLSSFVTVNTEYSNQLKSNISSNIDSTAITDKPVIESTSVTISSEARETLEEEISASSHESNNTTEESSGKTVIDKLIEDVIEKIRIVQEKLEQLLTKNDEASLPQIKVLENQLKLLNQQLVDLIDKKIELESDSFVK